jgi:hypothetical protein
MKGKTMRQRWTLPILGLVTCVGIGLQGAPALADADSAQQMSVAFGRGINTAQPGNPVNHVVIPDSIRIKQDGVVHFLVSGFHQLVIYKPGIDVDDIVPRVPPPPPPALNNFIESPTVLDATRQFYLGINPAGGPLETAVTPVVIPGPTPDDTRSNASNRVESVSFAEPGTYLVICNIRGHFLDGMFAWVKVLP